MIDWFRIFGDETGSRFTPGGGSYDPQGRGSFPPGGGGGSFWGIPPRSPPFEPQRDYGPDPLYWNVPWNFNTDLGIASNPAPNVDPAFSMDPSTMALGLPPGPDQFGFGDRRLYDPAEMQRAIDAINRTSPDFTRRYSNPEPYELGARTFNPLDYIPEYPEGGGVGIDELVNPPGLGSDFQGTDMISWQEPLPLPSPANMNLPHQAVDVNIPEVYGQPSGIAANPFDQYFPTNPFYAIPETYPTATPIPTASPTPTPTSTPTPDLYGPPMNDLWNIGTGNVFSDLPPSQDFLPSDYYLNYDPATVYTENNPPPAAPQPYDYVTAGGTPFGPIGAPPAPVTAPAGPYIPDYTPSVNLTSSQSMIGPEDIPTPPGVTPGYQVPGAVTATGQPGQFDANGNLIPGTALSPQDEANIYNRQPLTPASSGFRPGQLLRDAAGNVVDAAGNIIARAADIVGKTGRTVADFLSQPGQTPQDLINAGYQPGQGEGSLFPGGVTGMFPAGPSFSGGVEGQGGSFFHGGASVGATLPTASKSGYQYPTHGASSVAGAFYNLGGSGPINLGGGWGNLLARQYLLRAMRGNYTTPQQFSAVRAASPTVPMVFPGNANVTPQTWQSFHQGQVELGNFLRSNPNWIPQHFGGGGGGQPVRAAAARHTAPTSPK